MSPNCCIFAADLKKYILIVFALLSMVTASATMREEAYAMVDSAYALAMAGEMQQAIAVNNDGLSAVPEDSMAIRCEFYSCLLYCYHRLGDYQQALFYGEACLAFDEQDGDPANISASLGNLAGIYSSAGQHDVAIKYLERAIAIEESLLASDATHLPKSLAIRKAMLGEVLLAKSKSRELGAGNQDSLLHKALRLTEEALAIDRSLNRRLQEGMRLAQLGHIYSALRQPAQARQCNTEALLIARETDNKMTEVLCLLQLERYEEAAALAQQLGFRKQEYEACDHLYARAKAAGKNAEALAWLERTRVLYEQLQNEETQRQLTVAQVQYDTFRKERQLAHQQQEIQQKQARERLLLIGLLALAIVIALLTTIAVLLRHRKKTIELQAADKARQYSILSHDLKNPIVAQRQVLEQFYADYTSYSAEEIHLRLGQLLVGSDSLIDLLRNLQEIVQLHRNQRAVHPVRLDLSGLIKETVAAMQPIADIKSITFNIQAQRLLVTADRESLRTVIRNLLSNAIKFSPKGSVIEIGTTEDGCFVRDHGIGMDEEKKQELLSAKTQVKSTTGTNGESGTGFGLPLCRELIRLNKGTLTIDSSPENGTTVRVRI